MKTIRHLLLLLFTCIIGFTYLQLHTFSIFTPYQPYISILWNMTLCILIGLLLSWHAFLSQFKQFSIVSTLCGILLVTLVAYIGHYLYSQYIGTPPINRFSSQLSWQVLLYVLPFMLIGEECLSTNLLIAFSDLKLPFYMSTTIVSFLFAMWHLPVFHNQYFYLLLTIFPVRLLLNIFWKKSNSIWVSFMIHYVFDLLAFIVFYHVPL
ncbi:CPBP family intramembrane metalloprotease [Carnobacteriaceae bacterium zg-ZUI78]|nr:CPBP family intramembrane metalloprotease [Carnobacteriaceae bacterium zg-ZUI78]